MKIKIKDYIELAERKCEMEYAKANCEFIEGIYGHGSYTEGPGEILSDIWEALKKMVKWIVHFLLHPLPMLMHAWEKLMALHPNLKNKEIEAGKWYRMKDIDEFIDKTKTLTEDNFEKFANDKLEAYDHPILYTKALDDLYDCKRFAPQMLASAENKEDIAKKSKKVYDDLDPSDPKNSAALHVAGKTYNFRNMIAARTRTAAEAMMSNIKLSKSTYDEAVKSTEKA